MHLYNQNEVPSSSGSKVLNRQTYRQTCAQTQTDRRIQPKLLPINIHRQLKSKNVKTLSSPQGRLCVLLTCKYHIKTGVHRISVLPLCRSICLTLYLSDKEHSFVTEKKQLDTL